MQTTILNSLPIWKNPIVNQALKNFCVPGFRLSLKSLHFYNFCQTLTNIDGVFI